MSEDDLRLELGDRVVRPRSATLSFHVQTEQWVEKTFGPIRLPGRWVYDSVLAYLLLELEVDVDDESGEDGAPAPRLALEISRTDWQYASLQDLQGSLWQTSATSKVEAWYGNDAPPIEANRVTFGDWHGGRIDMDWRGHYRWLASDPFENFRLVGPVEFDRLQINVKQSADVDLFLAAAMPGFLPSALVKKPVAYDDYGPEMPPDRRKWELHSWKLL